MDAVHVKPGTHLGEIENPDGPAILKISRDGGKRFLDGDILGMEEVQDSHGRRRFRTSWKAPATDALAIFFIECGDARSEQREVRVLRPPVIEELLATCTWPEYTGIKQTESKDGHVEAVIGTTVTVSAQANHPITRAKILHVAFISVKCGF